jgi:hypothetical protein
LQRMQKLRVFWKSKRRVKLAQGNLISIYKSYEL